MNMRKITRDRLAAYANANAKHGGVSGVVSASSKTNSMALWMGQMSAKVYLNWAANIQREVTSHGYDLMITEMGGLCGDDSGHSPIPEWPVDGIFVYGLPGLSNSLELSPNHPPIISFGPYRVVGVDFVGLSFYDAGAE